MATGISEDDSDHDQAARWTTDAGEPWIYKTLQEQGRKVMEDGEFVDLELKQRSVELIELGWEPIEATPTRRVYRRAANHR